MQTQVLPENRVGRPVASVARGPRMGLPEPTTAAGTFDDSDSAAWLEALKEGGPGHDRAVERLHELLLRGARFEVSRRRASLGYVRGEELEDVAMQAADDALMAVLGKLDQFRGASRFTTWAYKFVLLEAGVRLRKRAWQEREVVLDSDSWTRLEHSTLAPGAEAEQTELLGAITESVGEDLTEHQRQVLVSLAIDGVPIDVLADRLGTTRNALYKTLHDARRKLRHALNEKGYPIEANS
jgi:RNA polymerase sigma-70 factor (ECF subfamily)